MAVYADVQDVEARYEGAIPSSARVETFLDDAETFLLRQVPNLADRITAGDTSAADAKVVVCNLVMRRLRNPAGYKGEHSGEYGYYYGSEQDWSAPTEGDLAQLGVIAGSGGWTIRPARVCP